MSPALAGTFFTTELPGSLLVVPTCFPLYPAFPGSNQAGGFWRMNMYFLPSYFLGEGPLLLAVWIAPPLLLV